MNIVYVVKTGEYDYVANLGFFTDKDKAYKYMELQKQIDTYEDFSVEELLCLDEEVDLNSFVQNYYNVQYDFACQQFFKSREKRIFTQCEFLHGVMYNEETELPLIIGCYSVYGFKTAMKTLRKHLRNVKDYMYKIDNRENIIVYNKHTGEQVDKIYKI